LEVFSSASHHDVLLLVFQIAILLLVARLLGELCVRIGQPSVIGEILAGIVLGPSLLSGAVPLIGEFIIPQTEVQGYLLEVISLIGAMFLLLITGLETDIKLIKRHAKTAIGVSFGGITITFLSGFLLGQYLPDFLIAEGTPRLIFSLFVATAMAISAIPVIAKVLMDMNLMRRDVGQTILAAGMSHDTIGWIMLSVVAGIAAGDNVTAGSVVQIVVSVMAFLVLSFTLGRWMVLKVLNFVQDEMISHDRLLTLVVVLTFLWGAITQALNLEAILGAFVMGILFGTAPRLPDAVHKQLESMALGIFAPIFFAVAGLKVNILNLADPTLIVITLIVIAIATFGKIAGTYLGARLIGKKDHWSALSFGAGLNARGAMEIIIATIGLRLGILSQDMFSIIVVMAIATSIMAPFALRWVLKRVKLDDEERIRLKKEELESGSMAADIHRVLLPIRSRQNRPDRLITQSIEGQLLDLLGKDRQLSVTLLTVTDTDHKSNCVEYLAELKSYFNIDEIITKVVVHSDPAEAILDEARKNYDMLVLGATERVSDEQVMFNPIIDYLVRMAPVPTLIVKSAEVSDNWKPTRILVPTNGSLASKNAADLAFLMGQSQQDCHVMVLNVISHDRMRLGIETQNNRIYDNQKVAHEIVDQLKIFGEAMGVATEAVVEEGNQRPEDVIARIANENSMDLIVVGTSVRPASTRLYMGPRVENIIQQAQCPVLIFNS
jgi:Kef-type K+ transport system membrane component KefB/nucleotide-binding universal stress UspA family protein